MEADEHRPEVDLSEAVVHHPAGDLREPEVGPGVRREHHRAEHDVVEVGDDEVAVAHVEVDRRAGQQHTGQTTEQERHQEADAEQHRCLEGELTPPHRADPVEELHPGRHRDEERQEGEERQEHRTGDEHVVRPHRDRQGADADGGVDEALVAEQRLAGEHRQDLTDDAEERQRQDVHLGMPEEPEQVLPEQRPAVGRVEHVRTEAAIGLEREQRRGEHREGDQHEDRRDQEVPAEDRQPEHRHAGGAQAQDRGDHVDTTEDGAQTRHHQAHDPQVGSGARGVDVVAQWRVGEPAERRGAVRGQEARDHREAAEQEQPVRQRVQPREGDVRRADLQRHQQVRVGERDRCREHQQHQRAVHGEQLVVLLVAEVLQPRPGELGPHQDREHAGEQEEPERRHEVHHCDVLV